MRGMQTDGFAVAVAEILLVAVAAVICATAFMNCISDGL